MSTVDKSILNIALSHTRKEIGLANMRASLKNNYEIIQKTHDSIHEFVYLAPLCIPSQLGVTWHSKSTFLTYQWEAFYQAHRSFLESLSGYYNAAYVLLRSTLELIVKGAFWECLAHERFREKATPLQLEKGKGKRKSLKDWIDALIEQEPSVRKDLEETSAAIFDKTAILFKNRQFQKQFVYIPAFSVMVNQLIEWEIIDIPNSFAIVYKKLYTDLSRDVHVVPDATDMGRRLVAEKDFMENEVIPEELTKYMKTLHEVIDLGIAVELNILKDWIKLGDNSKLKERLDTLRDLGLKQSLGKLEALVQPYT